MSKPHDPEDVIKYLLIKFLKDVTDTIANGDPLCHMTLDQYTTWWIKKNFESKE